MSGFTYFVNPCPACGRSSRIAVAYLGKQVRCRHCGRVFTARDPQADSGSTERSGKITGSILPSKKLTIRLKTSLMSEYRGRGLNTIFHLADQIRFSTVNFLVLTEPATGGSGI